MSDAAGQETLYFEAGSTQTFNGYSVLTLKGSSANLLRLRSTSTTGARWAIDAKGARSVSLLDVQDADNISGRYMQPQVSGSDSLDSGNNVNWFTPPDDEYDGGDGARAFVPQDQNYVFSPWFNIAMYLGGSEINMGDEMVNDGRSKYARNYAKGKYKTAVIVFEGKVLVASYNEKKGPDYKTATAVTGGQKTEQKGQIL
jgi:hypothetical protein